MSDKTAALAEAIRRGVAVIYLDTDLELVRAINEYNKNASDCRWKMKRCAEIDYAYLAINLLVPLALLATSFAVMFRRPVVAGLILLTHFACLIVFALVRKNLLISTLASALLLALDVKFGILLVGNVLLWLWRRCRGAGLTAAPGYPDFAEIQLVYERWPDPRQHP